MGLDLTTQVRTPMGELPQDERPCSQIELQDLPVYLDAEGDRLAQAIRSGALRVFLGNVYPIRRVARLKHCWPVVPGPVEAVSRGTPYIEIGNSRTYFQSDSIVEWATHAAKIEAMVDTLRRGGNLPGKMVMWRQQHPLDEWVIIIGNHTASAHYHNALENTQSLTLPVYRVEKND